MSKNKDFNQYRRLFNRSYKLSVNGKFKGLSTLSVMLGSCQFEHFQLKLDKLLSGRHGRYVVPVSERLTFKIAGINIVIYAY